MVRHGATRQGRAGHGSAGRGKAGKVRRGKVRRGLTWHVVAGTARRAWQGEARHGTARSGMARGMDIVMATRSRGWPSGSSSRLDRDQYMAGPDRLLDLLRRLIGRGRHWRGLQSYLCEQLDVPLRTVQRWLAELRKTNKILTHQYIDSRGFRNRNIYQLVEVDHGGPEVVKVVQGFSSSTTTGSKWSLSDHPYGKNRQDQKPSPKTRWEDIHVRKIAPTASQPGLFEVDRLDERPVSSDNKPVRKVSNRATKGSPTSRAITYWLAGRRERPAGYVIAGVGRAIKRCFDLNPGLTERDMLSVIDGLMLRGLDVSPKQYEVACGVLRPSKTRRDYSAQPTWKRLPHRSSMTQARKDEVSARSERLAAESLSRSLIRESRNSSRTLPGAPAPTPSPDITVRTVTDSDRRYGRWLLGLPIEEPTLAAEAPIDHQSPSGSMIEPAAQRAPRSTREEIEHVRYQEIMGVEASRPSVSAGSVLARLRARRATGDVP